MVCEEIVKANQSLASEIASIINETNYMYYRPLIPGVHFKYPIITVDEVINYMRSMEFFLCKLGGEIVGVIALKILDKEEGMVRFAYVKLCYQRKGIGSELLNFVVKQARSRGLKKLKLVVHSKALWAIRFYRNHGFTVVGFRDKGHGWFCLWKNYCVKNFSQEYL